MFTLPNLDMSQLVCQKGCIQGVFINSNTIDFICDTTAEKSGKFSPCAHIPIVPVSHFHSNKKDIAYLFAWNHKQEIFLKEKNLPQSINKLQNEVWGYSKFLETHTVETHIYRLRKKIKDKFEDDSFILTLSDGYKI